MNTTPTDDHQSTNLSKYQCAHPFAVARINNFFENLIGLVTIAKPSHILSIGCGEGFDTKGIYEKGDIDVVYSCGVDLNYEALRMAKELLAPFHFDAIQGNIYDLPFELRRFDIVLCLEVMEHLEYPDRVLRELSQRFDGHCVFSVPNEPLYRLTRLLLMRKNIRQLGDHPEHVNHWSKNGFVQLIRRYLVIDQVVAPFPWTMVLCHRKDGAR
jgi:2-polyprenyl-3-methyl-5-hydroxy-6-metoxy-1,4-benzoquinol methylase